MRYAPDGHAYTEVQFLQHLGDDRGAVHWQNAMDRSPPPLADAEPAQPGRPGPRQVPSALVNLGVEATDSFAAVLACGDV